MGNILEFDFETGGCMKFELLEGGELSIQLQAKHPSQAFKTTSSTVILESDKVEEIRKFLEKK